MRKLILCILLFGFSLEAQVPNTLSWQGILQDNNGTNLDGQFDITMRLFDVSSGGTALWSETQNNVQINDGLANLTLGEITPLNINFDTQLWLEVQIGAGTPLPRIKLTSVPYALSALSSIETDPTWSGSNDDIGNIHRNGNVGIGTEIPTQKLSVVGNSYFTGKMAIGYEGLPPNPFYFDVLSGASKRFTIFNFSGGLVGSFQNDGSKDGAVVRYRGLADEAKFWDVGQTDLNSFSINGRNNATLYILDNGNTGIGTDNPTALLHTNGVGTNAGNVLFAGEYVSPNPADPPASGSGSRMMWYPNKGAFRAGFANGSQWDKDNIGYFSVAMGASTTASALNSTALGRNTTASGQFSTAMGNETNASGTTSTALGSNTIASGDNSSSFGAFTTASGSSSAAFGDNTSAKSFCESVFGRWNTDYTPGSGWSSIDRLFVIGNGTASNSRSNAMTVLKNGRVGFQTVTSPTYALELPNTTTIGIGRGRANDWVLYSDGRLKTNRTEISYGLNEIMQLEPLKYFHNNSITENGKINILNEGANDIGFIAQDLYKILPEIVSRPEDESSDLWSVSYSKLTPVLVKAIQEQQSVIESQQNEINELKNQLSEIKTLLLNLNK